MSGWQAKKLARESKRAPDVDYSNAPPIQVSKPTFCPVAFQNGCQRGSAWVHDNGHRAEGYCSHCGHEWVTVHGVSPREA